MNSNDMDDERAAFEAWADERPYDLPRVPTGQYESHATESAWDGWQASAAFPQPVAQPVEQNGALDISVLARLSAQIFDCPLNPTISKFARAVEAHVRVAQPVEQTRALTDDFEKGFQRVFEAYSMPRDRFRNDEAWALFVYGKVIDALTPLQKVRAILTAARPASGETE